jgi:hypothetical protein
MSICMYVCTYVWGKKKLLLINSHSTRAYAIRYIVYASLEAVTLVKRMRNVPVPE